MENKVKSNQKLLKRKLLELTKVKRELEFEKTKDRDILRKINTPKLSTDILNLKAIKDEYGYCSRTIYRYRAKGLKFAKGSSKGFVLIVREELDKYLKQNMYD